MQHPNEKNTSAIESAQQDSKLLDILEQRVDNFSSAEKAKYRIEIEKLVNQLVQQQPPNISGKILDSINDHLSLVDAELHILQSASDNSEIIKDKEKQLLDIRTKLHHLVGKLQGSPQTQRLLKEVVNMQRSQRLVYKIELASENVELSPQLTDSFLIELKILTNDDSLIILSVIRGSIIIEIEGTEEGYQHLISAIQNSVKDILGYSVRGIRITQLSSESRNENVPQYTNLSAASHVRKLSNSDVRRIIDGILVTDSRIGSPNAVLAPWPGKSSCAPEPDPATTADILSRTVSELCASSLISSCWG